MSVVQKEGENIIIAKKVLFGDDVVDGYLCLSKAIGDSMIYAGDDSISFPGEYEQNGIVVVAWATTEGVLNYSIDFGNKIYTIIQSSSYFQQDECPDDSDLWIFFDADLKTIAIKNDYEGAFVVVDGDEWEHGVMGGDAE